MTCLLEKQARPTKTKAGAAATAAGRKDTRHGGGAEGGGNSSSGPSVIPREYVEGEGGSPTASLLARPNSPFHYFPRLRCSTPAGVGQLSMVRLVSGFGWAKWAWFIL